MSIGALPALSLGGSLAGAAIAVAAEELLAEEAPIGVAAEEAPIGWEVEPSGKRCRPRRRRAWRFRPAERA